MLIVFFSFQGIHKGEPEGVVKGILPIVESFDNQTLNKVVYYLGYVNGYKGIVNIRLLSKTYYVIARLINLINRTFTLIPYYKNRFINEVLYDFFASKKITEPVILISSAYLPRTQRKNKLLGGVNLFVAGNPDDFEINELLIKEQKKNDVLFNDAYTYNKRIKFISKSLFSYDHIVTFTVTEKESYSKRIQKEKVSFIESHIIPNTSAFPDLYFQKNNKITFCFVAHPFWLKGLPYLLEAWSKINTSDILLKVGGRIDNQLQKIIANKYSNLQSVEYFGWVDNLNQFMRTSHVCIVPSLLDAGPATVAEAMICGLPVVVSEGCGARTLIKDNINGFIIPTGDANALAEKINWFKSNPNNILKMGKEATKTINELAKSDQNKRVAKHVIGIINSYKI
ncbi:MAG: glycosyltransferase family 4 protein [Bacteroidales bacterium]